VGYRHLEVAGRSVEYVVDGPRDAADLLLFHVGTPSAAVRYEHLANAAAASGLRTAIYSRAGYGRSSPRQGQRVADEAVTSAALADVLGFDRFFVAGWSGGGPAALACAALLPDRVRACLTLASIAPWAEVGDAFLAWQPQSDIAEWHTLAGDDPSSLLPDYEAARPGFAAITRRQLAAWPGAPPSDTAATLEPAGFGAALARSIRRGVSSGVDGWLDEAIAHARDWGFRVADIRVPVVIRHGTLDPLVDVRHGRWLAATIPGARGVFVEDAGHGSIVLPWTEVVGQLVEAGR
jgi:pimeloyl-ACP methyl ester carboxylesterase